MGPEAGKAYQRRSYPTAPWRDIGGGVCLVGVYFPWEWGVTARTLSAHHRCGTVFSCHSPPLAPGDGSTGEGGGEGGFGSA